MTRGATPARYRADRDSLGDNGRLSRRTWPEEAASPTVPLESRRRLAAVRRRAAARRRGRLLVLSVIVALLVWGGTQVAIASGDAVPTPDTHVVKTGETLWGIVTVYYAGTEHDIRALIDEVMAANDLSTAALRPGQRITLPAEAD